ncbi:MAG: LacI family DNA-binding transcriptional regulator, partial [Burkholderiaceae bacterium]|nr:LacI family DNA-binding transcriptional regulator [Burkholderiaceae bacterium]
MQAVATAAGVSMSTVSHVINKTRKVHPDTQH